MVTKAGMRSVLAGAATLGFAMLGLVGMAGASQPEPWQVGLQPAATPIMEMVHRFNDGLMIVVTVIVLFVLGLLLYCVVRFNSRANPVPSRTTHNTLIEVVWTVVPILILVGIAVPSFALLFAEHDPARAIVGYDPEKDKPLTIKATGNQWYWSYDYPDNGDLSFDSLMLQNDQRVDPVAQPRLLAVDNEMIVPVGVVIRMQVIGNDVIHAFAMPSFGIKIDAIPGRLNQTWFRVDREGVYYGQCSELCGQAKPENENDLHGHAFMPIVIRAVSPEKFAAWATTAATDLKGAYKSLAETATPEPGVQVAGAVK